MSKEKVGIIDKLLHLVVTISPLLLIAAIAAGIGLAFYLNRADFAIRGLLIAVPTIFSAIYLPRMYFKNVPNDESSLKRLSLSQSNAIYAFIFLFIISIALLMYENLRTWHYTAIMSLIAVVIFYQILSKNNNKNIILIEIFALSLNLVYSVTLKYPFYFGSTDIAGHLFLTEVVNLSGHIIPEDLSLMYYYFPLFHIFNSLLYQFSGINLQTTFFVTAGIIYSFSIFVVYYLFKKATDNNTISLLTTLMYSLTTVVINYGPYVVTRTMAYIGFLFILYLLYKNDSKKSSTYMWLAIFMGLFTVLVHQVSAAQISGLMFILIISERLFSKKHYIPFSYFLLFTLGFLGYWFSLARPFLNTVMSTRTDSAIFENLVIKDTVQASNAWIYITQHLDITIFLFFALIGIVYLLWDRIKIHTGNYSEYYSVFAFFGLSTIILFIPTPIQTLWQTMTLFRFDRFMLLISPVMAFIMAAGIYLLLMYLFKNNNRVYPIFIISILIASFAFTSIFYAGPEQKDIIVDPSREYFTKDEMNGIGFLKSHVNNGARFYSDYYMNRNNIEANFSKTKQLNMPYYTSLPMNNIHNMSEYRGYLLIRQKAFDEGGIYIGRDNELFSNENATNKIVLYNSLSKLDKIYSNYGFEVYST